MEVHDAKKYREAESLYRESIDLTRAAFGDDHFDIGDLNHSLAELYLDQGDYAAAEPIYRQALEAYRRTYDSDDPITAIASVDHGYSLMKLERYEEAEELMLAGFGQTSEDLGLQDEVTRNIASRVAELYEAWGNSAEAQRFRALADTPSDSGDDASTQD